ncbi:MAM domain-containing glycosylphosphatidylinositol anchor protein 1 [Elysia marginata]|uniref:MAM domain-containing glycosylphosphatidylinositol anchor protein 1 n=1 Tax=Elysia marginata TaxID=1093978 RepID=A0AAV4IMS4_9GAST|nr:MAM domain-containing glycosylphosphatidylinositol anchor protein 1 [Elysia marginata]
MKTKRLSLSKGYYLYIETSKTLGGGISSGYKRGDTAILRTSRIPRVPGCWYKLEFWYNMYGRGIGTLGVKLHGKNEYLWSRSGQQTANSTHWREASLVIEIQNNSSAFQVEFVGVKGDSYLGDLAIDDIRIEQKCHNGETTVTPPPTKTEETATTITTTISSASSTTTTTPKTTTPTSATTTPTSTKTTPTSTTTTPTSTTTTPTSTTTASTSTTTTPISTTTTPISTTTATKPNRRPESTNPPVTPSSGKPRNDVLPPVTPSARAEISTNKDEMALSPHPGTTAYTNNHTDHDIAYTTGRGGAGNGLYVYG